MSKNFTDYTYELCVDSVESAINAGKGQEKDLSYAVIW